jgi:hypothetical protein
MNWEAVGALAEVFGAVGVIVTLAFLARQIQQNTRAVRASTNHNLNQQRTELSLRLALEPGAADLLLRGARSRDDLEPAERARHTLLLRAVIAGFEDAYVQFCAGMCDSETWDVSKVVLRQVISAPGFAAWWEQNRESLRSSFRSEVDALLRAA